MHQACTSHGVRWCARGHGFMPTPPVQPVPHLRRVTWPNSLHCRRQHRSRQASRQQAAGGLLLLPLQLLLLLVLLLLVLVEGATPIGVPARRRAWVGPLLLVLCHALPHARWLRRSIMPCRVLELLVVVMHVGRLRSRRTTTGPVLPAVPQAARGRGRGGGSQQLRPQAVVLLGPGGPPVRAAPGRRSQGSRGQRRGGRHGGDMGIVRRTPSQWLGLGSGCAAGAH